MRKMVLSTAAFFVLFQGYLGEAQEKRKTVAVLDFQSTGGVTMEDAKTLTSRFRGILVEIDIFNVVERDKMDAILREQDFTLTDACNTAECAVQVGQLLGVETMIAGDIGKIGQTYTIDMRLIDVTSGKILETKRKNYKGQIDGLLDAMQEIAHDFAKVSGKTIASKKPSKFWWYVAGGLAIAGGLTAVLINGGGGGSGSGDDIGIVEADLPGSP